MAPNQEEKATEEEKTKAPKIGPSKEPKIRWKKSVARAQLYQDVLDGTVPLFAKDANGKSTMKLKDIHLKPDREYSKCMYKNFSSRLSSIRTTIQDAMNRKTLDQEAFDNCLQNHMNDVSLVSHKGHIQWQDSDAQRLAKEDLANNENEALEWDEWYNSRPEFYNNFPLDAFRDKANQEIRTSKHLHTLEVRGKDTRKTKRTMKPHEHRPPMDDD